MSTILNLLQGSDEWHLYRSNMRNASESAAVLGVSPWTTPYQLWLIKTGRYIQPVNVAMQSGTDLEPAARLAYETKTGNIMQPLVLQDGAYSASLDGMTLDGKLIVEIKCPMRGQQSELWQRVAAGEVPQHYALQIQHQLMVSGAEFAHLWVFDGRVGILCAVERDESMMEEIRAGWDAFQHFIDTDSPPPLIDADTVLRGDSEWSAAATDYLSAKRQAEAATARLDAVKERLTSLCQHPREQGAGVSVTRYWKAGNVDYKRVPQLQGVNLNAHRGSAREELRVTALK